MRPTFAVGRSTATPHWDGHGIRPDGWEGWDDCYDLDYLPPDDPDLIAAAMDEARETDKRIRERIVEYISDIPDPALNALTNYVNLGEPPGDFLTAVLENDLAGAIALADTDSLSALRPLVVLLFNEAPTRCWRSPDRVAAWLRMRDDHRADIVANCASWQRFMEVVGAPAA